MGRLIDDLNVLHDHYVEAVNNAVAIDDLDRAQQLAADYDSDAIQLIAEREGRTHLLPISRPTSVDSGLRALIRRLTGSRAA